MSSAPIAGLGGGGMIQSGMGPNEGARRGGSLDSRTPANSKSKGKPAGKACSDGEKDGDSDDDGDGDGKNVDEKKARRMLSNRESARRSRQRKQQHLDDLQGQVSQLRNENLGILHRLAMVAQLMENLGQENGRLRGEAQGLSSRLGYSTMPPMHTQPNQMMHNPQNPPAMHPGMHGQPHGYGMVHHPGQHPGGMPQGHQMVPHHQPQLMPAHGHMGAMQSIQSPPDLQPLA